MMQPLRGTPFKADKALAAILVVGLLFRIGLLVWMQPWNSGVLANRVLVDDALEYHTLALGVIQDGSFASFGAFRTPAYPLFLSAIYTLFGVKPWLVLLAQVMLSLLTIILVYKIALNIIRRETVALVAALLLALDPHQILLTTALLTDTLFVALFVAAIYFFVLGLRNRNHLPVSAIFLGLSVLVRPVSLFFPLVIACILFLQSEKAWRFRVAGVFTYVAVFALTLSPWLYRNAVTYNEVGVSTIQGYNLLFYNAAYTEVEKTGKPIAQVRSHFKGIADSRGANTENPFEASEIYKKVALEYISANWVAYTQRHLKGIVNMYAGLKTRQFADILGFSSSPLSDEQFAAPNIFERIVDFFRSKTAAEIVIGCVISCFLLVCYLTLIPGIRYVTSNVTMSHIALLTAIILYFSLLTGVVGLARYKLPITAFYVIISSAGLVVCWAQLKKRLPVATSMQTKPEKVGTNNYLLDGHLIEQKLEDKLCMDSKQKGQFG